MFPATTRDLYTIKNREGEKDNSFDTKSYCCCSWQDRRQEVSWKGRRVVKVIEDHLYTENIFFVTFPIANAFFIHP